MLKRKTNFAKRLIVILAVLAMVTTGLPKTWPQVKASAKEETVFKTTDYRKLRVGDSYDFDLRNKKAGSKYEWSSSDNKIATVNQMGVVKAVAVGEAKITCKVTKDGKTTKLNAKVSVVKASKETAKKVKINNKIASMAPGETYDLNRTFSPKKVSDYVNWTSSNTNVATVDKNGIVTAKAEGMVEICVRSLNGKAKDKVTIYVSTTVVASTQKDINRLLKAENASTIMVDTNKEVELTIPAGDYSSKKLIVNAPKASIGNSGVFENIEIRAIKPSTWHEKAKNNKISVCGSVSIVIDENAFADISIDRSKITAKLEINGAGTVAVNKKADVTLTGSAKDKTPVTVNARGTSLKVEIAVALTLNAKITLEFKDNKTANLSTVSANNNDCVPAVKGEVVITVKVGDKYLSIDAKGATDKKPDETPVPGGTSGGGATPVDPNRVKVDANGFDEKGRVVAYFGAPDNIDGEIDDVWKTAVPVKFTKTSMGSTTTTATVKVLWDDHAVYFLAEVKDANLSVESGNVYEKDSFEFFLDQDDKRQKTYEGDDCQFRINYKNEQSCDHGDLTNLYSAAKEVPGGYVIEGRVALSMPVANDKVMGMEAQINDATGSTRIAVINVFDESGNAFQDTSKFGEMVLVGKGKDAVSKPNFYDLKSLVISAKDIELDRYINGNVVADLITESEKAIADPQATQEKYDELFAKLTKAIKDLMHNTKSFDEKECRDIPKEYKISDPESIRGSIVRVDYKTNTYDDEAKDLDKYMLVYLPHGYKQDDPKKYNVMYLIHGMSESQHTAFGGVGQNTELMRAVDHLIADGKMEPMIIVTPTWYDNTENEDMMFRIKNFNKELTKDIIPTIESKYNVYAKSTSVKDLIAARDHRAVGGFSMGSACTWYNYIYAVDYFKYYVPVSLWCWQDIDSIKNEGYTFTGTDDEIKAQYLAQIAKNGGYTKDGIRIFCATGTADLAYGGMNSQIAEMKKLTDMFVYSADLRKGNFYYITLPGGAHNWTCVDRYLYNILPDLFRPYWTDDYGLLDGENPTATAEFGSPVVDGQVDAIWGEARKIVPKYSSTPEDTTASFRVMWDDLALYVLAEVKDQNVTKESVNPYEQDSMELFLDQNNDKTEGFGVDDLQFRINYANDTTADKGDLTRLYSQTSTVDGGYVIEARIEWKDIAPKNDDTYGLELQINDGKGATRAGTINVFDGTNNAWQNTALFGNVALKGKTADDVTFAGPYKLLGAIQRAKKLDQTEYTEETYAKLAKAIEDAQKVLADKNSTQEQMDAQVGIIEAAIQGLEYTPEAKKVKRFVALPSEYKAKCASGGSLAVIDYTYKKDGAETEDKKKVNIYLPYGYDPSDTDTLYNVFYLMHGGGENEDTCLVPTDDMKASGEEKELKLILDNMISKGDIKPMIVVCPTSNAGEGSVEDFYKELNSTIIPMVETKYNTYYSTGAALTATTVEGKMHESREHRAFGGFSMGSLCTWNVLLNSLDYIKYYVPLSGECRAKSTSKETAEFIAQRITDKGYAGVNGFKLFCATGSGDIAYPNMNPMLEEMKKIDTFIFDQNTQLGNTYFLVADGGTHAWNHVDQYLYDIMPDLFK